MNIWKFKLDFTDFFLKKLVRTIIKQAEPLQQNGLMQRLKPNFASYKDYPKRPVM